MPKTYTRLTEEERYQIYEGVAEKWLHREIATLINKYHSTVSREIKRNTGLRGYKPKQAQERIQNKPRHRKLTLGSAENIQHEWSPNQIQGRLRSEELPMVCATTIYVMASSGKIRPLAAIFTSTFIIGNPTKDAQVHLKLEAKLSAVCPLMKDRPSLIEKFA